MKLSVVIPNYNGAALLKANLPVVAQVLKSGEIIIIDDCSTDDSVSVIKDLIQKLKLKYPQILISQYKTSYNKGFASSVNLGVSKAHGQYIILLNTDVYPQNRAFEIALQQFTDNSVFAVGMLQKSIESNKTFIRGRGIGRFSKGFLVHSRGETNKDNTLWVSGGAGIFEKSIWNTLGGMNYLYDPFYWEDIDLSYRALKWGYKIKFAPQACIIHEQDKGAIRTRYNASDIKKITYRNQIMFVWLNTSDMNYLTQHIIYLGINLIRSLLSDGLFFWGFISAVKLFSSILKVRRQVQKGSRLTDNQVLKNYLN